MSGPSIRRDLLRWSLGALMLGSLVLVLVAYVVTLAEMNEVLDQNLQEVAASVAQYHAGARIDHPVSVPLLPGDKKSDNADLITQIWHPDGTLVFASSDVFRLPFIVTSGAHQMQVGPWEWRIYTVVQSDAVVQVAQRTSARRQMARESASKLFVPLVVLAGLLGVLLAVALRRGMRPLDEATLQIAQRNARTLEPIDERGMPREILPLVRAFNDLMHRLDEAFEMQRRFIADAAHELRTPVAALRLQMQLLDRAADEPARTAAATQLRLGIDRSQRLVEQLLQLSRSQPEGEVLAMEDIRLDELVQSVVAEFDMEAERRGIDLGALTDRGLTVRSDSYQLRILLNNLVRNALRYSPAGSKVDVVATQVEGRPALLVIDNGPGIEADQRERVFERFHRGEGTLARHNDPSGSGLGLAIVKAIAQRTGATVSLDSTPGGGGLEVRIVFGAPTGQAMHCNEV
jgi:signal transduction histidine kinase